MKNKMRNCSHFKNIITTADSNKVANIDLSQEHSRSQIANSISFRWTWWDLMGFVNSGINCSAHIMFQHKRTWPWMFLQSRSFRWGKFTEADFKTSIVQVCVGTRTRVKPHPALALNNAWLISGLWNRPKPKERLETGEARPLKGENMHTHTHTMQILQQSALSLLLVC